MQKDSWDIDYQATKNALDAGREQGAQQFVLLSAICVQKPLLEFQKAKLKFEADLMEAGDINYSIVRPTAFFKSLAGQVLIRAASSMPVAKHKSSLAFFFVLPEYGGGGGGGGGGTRPTKPPTDDATMHACAIRRLKW